MSIDVVSNAILDIGGKFGVPAVVLGLVLWMGREAAIAVHQTVVSPIVTSHTRFIDTISEQSRQQTEVMGRQADAFRELAEAHEEQITILREAFPASGGRRTAQEARP
jgi:hypothetical protein